MTTEEINKRIESIINNGEEINKRITSLIKNGEEYYKKFGLPRNKITIELIKDIGAELQLEKYEDAEQIYKIVKQY